MKRCRALVNVINKGHHRAALQEIAQKFNWKYVAPVLDGETRVSGICFMFRALLVLRLLLIDYNERKPGLLTDVLLTDEEWHRLAELLAIVEVVEDDGQCAQAVRGRGTDVQREEAEAQRPCQRHDREGASSHRTR